MEDYVPTIELKVEQEKEVVLKLDEGSMPDPYHGEYIIYPKVDMEQQLKTKNKSMSDNVTVMEIPVSEVSNESGTTFIIGGM